MEDGALHLPPSNHKFLLMNSSLIKTMFVHLYFTMNKNNRSPFSVRRKKNKVEGKNEDNFIFSNYEKADKGVPSLMEEGKVDWKGSAGENYSSLSTVLTS